MGTAREAQSPTWGKSTKLIVFLVALVVLVLLAWRFQLFIGMIVMAVVLAYLLNPLINLLSNRTFLSRGAAVWITYLLLAVVVLGGAGVIGVAAYTQVSSLWDQLPKLISDVFDLVKQYVTNPETTIAFGPIQITPYTFDWGSIETQVLQMVNPVIEQGFPVISQTALGAFNVGGTALITFFVSIYIAQDMPERGQQLHNVARQIGYGEDFEHLGHGFNRIWNAYLRGQFVYAIIIALITSAALAILGVQNALALGILTGILQVIPYLGTIIVFIITALVAFFQGGNYLGLMPFQYALLVTIVSIILQNIEGTLLFPRVVGVALDLSPLLVFLSVLAGAALAGILGMLLAAPVIATIKLLGRYIWRKLLDLPPFPEPEVVSEPPPPGLLRLRDWLSRLLSRPPKQQTVSK